jgi:hypothetical protein
MARNWVPLARLRFAATLVRNTPDDTAVASGYARQCALYRYRYRAGQGTDS